MSLYQAARDRQAQTAAVIDTPRVRKHAEIFEDLLMVFRGNTWARVGDRNLDGVQHLAILLPTFLPRRRGPIETALPKKELGCDRYFAPFRSEFECVLQEVRDDV